MIEQSSILYTIINEIKKDVLDILGVGIKFFYRHFLYRGSKKELRFLLLWEQTQTRPPELINLKI